jgi:hypothetical protein
MAELCKADETMVTAQNNRIIQNDEYFLTMAPLLLKQSYRQTERCPTGLRVQRVARR